MLRRNEWASIPAEVRAHSVGSTLTGFIGVLSGVHGMSKRGIEELIEQSFDVSIALRTIANREQELSAALAAATPTRSPAISTTILVIDLGKFNSVLCWLNP